MRPDGDSPGSTTFRSRSNRVSRACDRCRIRKIKCNGISQCSRCSLDDAVCVYTKRRRPNDRAYSKEYVQLLEEQQIMLVKGVKELYRRSSRGEALPELPIAFGEHMLIHEVLSSLNVLPESQKFPDDQASTAGDFSASSSVCGSTPSESFFADRDWQLETPSMSTSPASLPPREITASPEVPSMAELDGLLGRFDAEKLGLDAMSILADPTPKAIELSFKEAFSDVYFMGQDITMDGFMRMEGFVNPRDTYHVLPMHLTHAHTE